MIKIKNKICLLGESGVGKSSIMSLLKGKEVPQEREPTVGLDIETTELNPYGKVSLWDFGGQNRYKFMWNDFLRGAGLTVLVTDSTEENLTKCKEIYNRFSRRIGSKIIAIANKQDLPGALSEEEVQKTLGGIKTYGMCAIRKDLRDRMHDILDYEMSTE